MIIRVAIIIYSIVIVPISLVAQNCTAHASYEFIELSKQMAQSELRQNHGSGVRSSIILGVKFWDVKGTNQTTVFTNNHVNRYLSALNSEFGKIGVSFQACSELIDYYNDDLAVFDKESQGAYLAANCYDPNVINVYLINTSNGGSSAEFPNSNYTAKNSVFLDKRQLLRLDIGLVIHEMGHFFGLFHTFGAGNVVSGQCLVTDELPNGSNSLIAGDLIADTPADPGLDCNIQGKGSATVNDYCEYVATGDFTRFNPLTTNFMSYNFAAFHCTTKFTNGQITRMQSFVPFRSSLVCSSGGDNCEDVFEPNNTRTQAHFVGNFNNLADDKGLVLKISEPNDLDYYRLSFTNGGTIRIILGNINQTDKDFNIKLFKNDELVGLSENVHPIGDRIEFQVSDLSANYYILVYGANYNQWSCHDKIRLGIDWRPNTGSNPTDCSDIYEPNNGFGLASYFAGQNFGSVNYSGSIYPKINGNYDDPDYYKVVTNQWGTLDITIKDFENDLDLYFYNGSKELVFSQRNRNAGPERIIWEGNPGTYFIVVNRGTTFESTNCRYNLTVNWTPGSGGGGNDQIGDPCSPRPDAIAEPNETFAQAFYNPSFMNVSTNGHDAAIESHLATSADVDMYRIEFQMGVVMRWQLCAPQNLNATFTIFDVNGNIKHEETASNCTYFYNNILSAGTYYVKIRSVNGQFNCTAPYQFHFTVLGVTDNGGGNNNNLTCAGAFELEMNKEWSCGNAWYLGCPVYTHGSTQNLPDKKNTHNCSGATWSGGEKVYKVTARDQNVCHGGVGVQLNNYTGNPEDWGVFLYTDCALTNCRPHASYWDFGNGEIEYHFEVPDGEYYVVIDNVNSSGGEYDIFTNSLLWPSPPNDVCYVIFNGEDPIPFIDYSDDNDACSCSLLENPTISQSGSVCTSTGALLQSSTPCSSDPNIEIRWYDSAQATVPVASGNNYIVHEPGLYYAEVYNTAMGCGSSRTPILVGKPPLAVTAQITNASCMGDGQILLSASGPNPISSYSFRWITGDLGYELDALSRGLYTVTVTDANGCTTESSYYIESDAFDITLLHDNSDCIVSPNRNLYAAKSGESKIANILWNTGDTTNTITTADYGIYKVTITDVNGCTASDSIWIENKPFRAWANINKPSCNGQNDGSISLSALDGVFPYRYDWGNGGTVSTIDNLSAGSYSYTITDSRGCQIDNTIIIDEPDSLVIFSKEITPTCWDSLNGSISVFPKGGTPFYNYRWNTGASENEVTHLDAGIYNVTISDWKNCEQTLSLVVSKPDSIDVVRSVTNVSCFGLADGGIDITAIGGTLPFRFDWQAGDTLPSLTNLKAGSYYLTITDANGCQKSGETIVIQPAELKSTSSVTHVKCYGGSDGSFTVLAQGGTPPYNYDFSSGNGINLPAGRYSIIISDLNNCINLDTIIINEPYPLEANITASNVSCAGFADGSISADVVGGTSPYQYNWNGNSSLTNSVENLYPGEVTVEIIDSNNCLDTRFVTITEPEPLVLKTEVIDESCVGNLDGSITVFHEGGTLPISVLWSNGGNTNQNKGISSGSYTVTILDNNGCILDSTIYVNSLPPLTYELNPIPVTCSYTSDGQLYLENIKGVQPLSITIDNGQSFQSTFFENLEAGNHEIVMIDGNNCRWNDDFEIGKPLAIEASILASSDSIQLGEKVTLSVSSPNYTLGGIIWQPQNLVDCPPCTTVEIQPFFTQNYVVIVRNDIGCEQKIETLVKVSRERKVFVPNVFSPNGDGVNDYFTIFGGLGTTNIKSLKIIDRFGNIMFDKTNLSLNNLEQGWDGMHKGNNAAASGVYVYVAEMEFVDGEVIIYKGDVTLLK